MTTENEGTRRSTPVRIEIRFRLLIPSGRHTLVTTSIGIRVCVSILDRLEGPLDLPEEEDDTKIFELG